MKLEQQVCSLKLAKRLKELGVKQESLSWWTQWGEDKNYYLYSQANFVYDPNLRADRLPLKEKISAFTFAELEEVLEVVLKEVK